MGMFGNSDGQGGSAGIGRALRAPWRWWKAQELSRRLMLSAVLYLLAMVSTVLLVVFYAALMLDASEMDAETGRASAVLAAMAARGEAPGADLARRFATEAGLSEARFGGPEEIAEGQHALPVPTHPDRFLIWEPRRIGSEMVGKLAPLRVGATAIFLIGLGYAFWRLYRLTVELERRRRAAHAEARRDGLTGLVNRLGFDETLSAALAEGVAVGVLSVDLDSFKLVNDLHGHGTGDEMLRLVAERLVARAHPGDLVARIGGDEFAVLRTEPGEHARLLELAADLDLALAEPIRIGSVDHAIGASVGTAIAPEDGRTPEAVMRAADIRLYADKRDGREAEAPQAIPRVA